MIAIGLRYLTGFVAASGAASRNEVEWPPHPGRVFMALAASYFETRPEEDSADYKESQEEWDALVWLEQQKPPGMNVPDCHPRSVVDVYVPPNDMNATTKTVIPDYRTNRQPRTFPKAALDDEVTALIWQSAEPSDATRSALSRLCGKLIRVGHSSSFVQAWVVATEDVPVPNLFVEESGRDGVRLRVPCEGTLDYLVRCFGEDKIERFESLSTQIETAKGKELKTLKLALREEFGNSKTPPDPMRPVLSATALYTKVITDEKLPVVSAFDADLIVLGKFDGPNLGLEATWQLLTALRGTIESACQPTPEWVSGHQPDGAPSKASHLALLPLSYVGSQYADGHLLGVALAVPRSVAVSERMKMFGKWLYNENGEPRSINLQLGKLGTWTVKVEERSVRPQALELESWTKASTTWASVSPVVLDRHPRIDPQEDRGGWMKEVAEIVSKACERIGLPAPLEVDVDKTSWHRGAPRSQPGRGGFALMPSKQGGPVRPQVHVWLRFKEPVIGPVILGAGRYRGYGMCKPWNRNNK